MPSISRAGFTYRFSTISPVTSQLIVPGANLATNEGVQLLASPSNGETIYVGYNNLITANAADATDGFPLQAGASLFMPCRHASDIWLISPTLSNLVVWFIGQ
jgi:hypothetical protein